MERRHSSAASLRTRLGNLRDRIPNRMRKKRKRKSTLCSENNPAAILLKIALDQPAQCAILAIDDRYEDEGSGSSEDDGTTTSDLRELKDVLKDVQKCQKLIAEQLEQLPTDPNRLRFIDFERFALLKFTASEFSMCAQTFVELSKNLLEKNEVSVDAFEKEVFFDALDISTIHSSVDVSTHESNSFNDTVNEENKTVEMPIRRTRIPQRPSNSINYLALMRNCIGKDLSKIAMPVDFNEPLSALQRSVEELEYSHLLDEAALETNPYRRLALVSAFAISAYPATGQRSTKPFNPILGETYECDRRQERDRGFIAFAEQVSHHPPCSALYSRGKNWTLSQLYSPSTRIKGRSLLLTPIGRTHVKFTGSMEEVISYNKATTRSSMTNLISGKLQTENLGEVTVISNRSDAKCILKFHDSGYFSKETRKVTGTVTDAHGNAHYDIDAVWDEYATIRDLNKNTENKEQVVWTVASLPEDSALMHGFSRFAIELNEIENEVELPPTDSRFRVDQRVMEEGNWQLANELKKQLEDKQRERQREREELGIEYKPIWFKRKPSSEMLDEHDVYEFKDIEYFRHKNAADWSICPKIFDV
ncbi:Oxysterol-binding protein [Aphelenchoides besseyi]|nr:Oxysterol-binding protein [Aphelenchoides besseyi]